MGTLVKKDNTVIEASYNLTRLEQCCLLYCLTQIGVNDTELADYYSIRATEFGEMFGIDDKRSYRELQNIVNLLFDRYVLIPLEDGKRLKTRWVSGIRYDDGNGELRITIAKDIKPYLLQLKREFTAYDIRNIAGFNSKYAIRIYEIIVQWQHSNRDQVEIQIIELRDRLQLEDKYTSTKDLRRFVIEPAVKDINESSNLSVQFKLKKKGRKFVSVVFTFKEKQTKEEKAKADLEKKQQQLSLENTSSRKPKRMPTKFIVKHAHPGMTFDECYASESLKRQWAECQNWGEYL